MKKLSMLINARDIISHISPEIYGHFSEHLGRCIYNGIYVGEDSAIPNTDGIRNDIIEAFREIKVPVLRWPGGCFADEYHWKDGIGKKSERKKMINTNWGGVTEDNSFGTHEFFRLCELVGCEPYLSGNVGSGTVRELSEWIEYITSDNVSPMTELRKQNGREKPWKLKYLGIGNENWGCGGNMRPEFYADVYRRFQSFCKNYGDNKLFRIACGPGEGDIGWTEGLMKNITHAHADAISLHHYTLPTKNWTKKGDAVKFGNEEYYSTIAGAVHTDDLIARNIDIMNRYDPKNEIKLTVDEWGCWYDVMEGTNPGFLYQQNTMRDAVVAAYSLNIFNRRSDRVVMANIAQVVNVLQAIILTEGEAMIKTPTYHVFDLFKDHQGGENVYCWCDNEKIGNENEKVPMISSSASVKDGVMTITLANASLDEDAEISCDICGFNASSAQANILTGEVHALNDIDNGDRVKPAEYSASVSGGNLSVVLPACSVVTVTVK